MTQQQKIIYESLKETDVKYNRNEAEKYLTEIIEKEIKDKKNRTSNSTKETIDIFMKKSNDDEYIFIKYPWSIGFTCFSILMIILIFTIGMNDLKILKHSISIINETGILLTIFYMFVMMIFWISAIFSILKNDFVKDGDKISWLVGTIFIPLVFAFYFDMEKNLIE